jgi:alpha-beta hydrolase superfamily lysophospholipase
LLEFLLKKQTKENFQVEGVVLLSPLIKSYVAKSIRRRSISRLREIVGPTTLTPAIKETKYLSRDESVVKAFADDKYNFFCFWLLRATDIIKIT